jgi:hypothetical protein
MSRRLAAGACWVVILGQALYDDFAELIAVHRYVELIPIAVRLRLSPVAVEKFEKLFKKCEPLDAVLVPVI